MSLTQTALRLLAPALALVPLMLASTAQAQPREFHTLKTGDKSELKYTIVYPAEYQESKTYPVLLALPPGEQDERMVDVGLASTWEAEAKKRGWVIVSPAAPRSGKLFMPAAAAMMPELIDEVAKTVKIEGGKVHVAGISNGGRAAFKTAVTNPERYASLTVLPGHPDDQDMAKLEKLNGIPVVMYAGEKDAGWLSKSRAAGDKLNKAGIPATLEVMQNQSHMLSIPADQLWSRLESARIKGPAMPDPSAQGTPDQQAVAKALDDFHDAAAKADEKRYFSHFAPEGVFIGTDPKERWNAGQFRKYVNERFSKGTGWKYTPKNRNIRLTPEGTVAWFDEMLDNAKYGECRGSGVLRKLGGEWMIVQYNLSVPIPNEQMENVMKVIKK